MVLGKLFHSDKKVHNSLDSWGEKKSVVNTCVRSTGVMNYLYTTQVWMSSESL